MTMTMTMTRAVPRRLRWAMVAAAAGIMATAAWSQSPNSRGLPQVELNARDLQPRPIEDLTETSIIRDYARAWQTLATAFDENRPDLLDSYFTGFAKNNFSQLIGDQKRTGVRVHYIDHGHKLNAFFYSPAGDAMQLRDQAEMEVQIFDGGKTLHREQVRLDYLVLMTPGADRWLIRDLETTAGPHP
jgi:hypothetical protein